MKIADARQALADALSAVDGLAVRPRPPVPSPRPGDGWIVVARWRPSTFRCSDVTLQAIISLGTDTASSERLLDELAPAALDAAGAVPGLPTGDLSLEPDGLILEGGTTLNIAILRVMTEVEQ